VNASIGFPDGLSPEKELLRGFLAFHQDALIRKVAGIPDVDARRALVPSGTSLAGLVKHTAYVHAKWFDLCFADGSGDDPVLPWPPVPGEMTAGPEETIDVLVDRLRRKIEIADQIIDAAKLDDLNRGWHAGGYVPGTFTLRWIMLHMIEEMARHNGHADIIREQLDGTVGV
jgi:uncharacterized damage-inducible protein DinB